MKTLSQAFPELCAELQRAMEDIGEGDLGRRFSVAAVREVRSAGKIGYIGLANTCAAAGRTIVLENAKSDIILDIASDGTPIGVEVMNPNAALKAILRRGAAV